RKRPASVRKEPEWKGRLLGGGLRGLALGGLLLALALGGRRRNAQHDRLRVGDQLGTGGQLDLAGGDAAADLQALHRVLHALGDGGGLGGDLDRDQLLADDAAGGGVAGEVHRDLDVDLLALLHDEQVDVLKEALDRVALHALGQDQVLGALDTVHAQQHVRGLQGQHQVMAGKRDVARLGAVAVEDGRHLTRAAGATRGALAEFRARLGSDTYLGHDKTPRRFVPAAAGNTTSLKRLPRDGRAHGICPAGRRRRRSAPRPGTAPAEGEHPANAWTPRTRGHSVQSTASADGFGTARTGRGAARPSRPPPVSPRTGW